MPKSAPTVHENEHSDQKWGGAGFIWITREINENG
jgi:hypothetical protein